MDLPLKDCLIWGKHDERRYFFCATISHFHVWSESCIFQKMHFRVVITLFWIVLGLLQHLQLLEP